MTGILATIKKTIGIAQEDTSFDEDLLLYINATMLILSQLGLKEADVSKPINSETTWADLLGDRTDLEVVKTYIHFKVKSMFDPPTSSALIEAHKNIIAELEWRINNLEINKGVTTIV